MAVATKRGKMIVESNICHHAKLEVIFMTQFGYFKAYSQEQNMPIFPQIFV